MAIPLLKGILSVFSNKQATSGDHLEVYPQKMHVRALPERRYLKTARFLVICCILTMLFNFSICFFYIRDTKQIHTFIYNPNPAVRNTFLYAMDYYNKELKPIQKKNRYVSSVDLVGQSLITDFLTLRYELVPNIEEMQRRWSQNGKLASFLTEKKYEEMKETELSEKFTLLRQGITQKVYIYSIQPLNGSWNANFYEAVFDVFSLKENVYGAEICRCFQKNEECLACLNRTKIGVKRYKAYMRVSIDLQNAPRQTLIETDNPLQFLVTDYYLMEYRYIPDTNDKDSPSYSPWEDPNNIIDNT